jgi:DNA-binding NtrC family response regulator
VEDEKLKHDLEQDFQVLPCEQSEDLIQKLQQHRIAIILFQINSDKTELEKLQRIFLKNKKLPVIVIGSGKQMELVAQAFQEGAMDFFRIPYQRDLLVERARFLAGISIA